VGFSFQSQEKLLAQFVEQRLGVLQVGGVETLGELLVDFSEHRTRLLAAAQRRRVGSALSALSKNSFTIQVEA
jgi:hypothetical protein